jgi:SRSO17 transposase
LLRRDGKHQPISVKKLAIGLPPHAWRKITWREATAEPLSSRFARVRVRAAHRDYWLAESRPEEWLLIEWPEGEEVPPNIGSQRFRRTLRSVSSSTPLSCVGALSAITKNSNSWRGFHHHATLCIAAYGFLVSQRETIPPSGTGSARLFKKIPIPETYRPRGSACGLNGTFQIRSRPFGEH